MTMLIGIFGVLFITLASALTAQDSSSSTKEASAMGKSVDYLLNYLNMAGTITATEFCPLTQRERTDDYLKTLVNPLSFVKAGFSAGVDQWNDKPEEWEQGGSGYAKRFVNILGQYTIQRSLTFSLASLLHEDNRYFNSGRKGIWSRTGYAVTSGILARSDDGKRHLSISQLGGVAAGAFLSRSWQPPNNRSAGDGAVSFGITMASNLGTGVLKEFLPDLGRMLTKGRKDAKSMRTQIDAQNRRSLEAPEK